MPAPAQVGDADLALARELREAIQQLGTQTLQGKPLARAPLAFLEAFNHLALYNCRHTLTLLSGEPWNVRCPHFDAYVDNLVRYVREVHAARRQKLEDEVFDPFD